MRNIFRKNTFGYIAVTLALVMTVVSVAALAGNRNTAGAEAVQVTENATVVTSPFTEAVAKVQNSVVGVNNYVTYNYGRNYFGYGFGYS